MSNNPRDASIVRVAVFCPLRQLFDYRSGDDPAPPGALVKVPFGPRQSLGVVVEQPQQAAVSRLKTLQRVIEPQRINAHLLALLQWCWRYYQHPPGEVLAAAIPAPLRKTRPYHPEPEREYCLSQAGQQLKADDFPRAPRQRQLWQALQNGPQTAAQLRTLMPDWGAVCRRMQDKGWIDVRERTAAAQNPEASNAEPVTLNAEQAAACEQFGRQPQQYHCSLLDGVTGSGKTEVYIALVREQLNAGRQCLLLVPEIGLVTQLVQRIEQQLGVSVGIYHSGVSEQQRANTWLAAGSGQCQVVVGTRSAVFVPLAQPGLIIVDEEHDPGYKQFEGFHYSARDVAIKRAQILDIPVVLGSATPSLESLANVEQGRYALLQLTQRHAQVALPQWTLVDCRATPAARRESGSGHVSGILHPDVRTAMQAQLADGQQVLVFQNRRGYAPLLQCPACGWQADCRRCSAHLTWHRRAHRLQCHHCEYTQSQPRQCPECAAPELMHFGSGTEQLEQVLAESFAGYPVHRVDSDSMRSRSAMQSLREVVLGGEPCVLVGTQMLTKGHHFPGITLVVAVDVDQALFSADFRATERLAQQLVQVAGRAGRGEQPGRILLQTRQPAHGLLRLLVSADYRQVAAQLLRERQQAMFPPYSAQAIVRADALKAPVVEEFLHQVKAAAASLKLPGEILGPVPALLEKRAGRFRYQLWWQAAQRGELQRGLPAWVGAIQALRGAGRVRWHMDVDPVAL